MKHIIYRIRFTYSDNGIIFSQVALIRAINRHFAERRLCKWFLSSYGVKSDFKIKSCSLFNDADFLIDNVSDLVSDFSDLPPDKVATVADTVSSLGDFDSVLASYNINFK